MLSDWFDRARGFKDELPNRFSIAMGELIRQARVDAKMSQVDLAEKAFMNQAAISLIEKGKREVTASEIVYLGVALNRPILYFFPPWSGIHIDKGDLTSLEVELLSQARRLTTDDLRRLIAQAKAIADFDTK